MPSLGEMYRERFGLDAPHAPETPVPDGVAGILGRRTIRRYKPDPVPEPMLDMLLACAQSAPAKSDLQQYSIIHIRDEAKQREIGGWLPNMPWIATAPVLLIFCGDMRRQRRLGEFRAHPHDNNNVDTFMNASVDAALAMMCFINAAEAAGLGACCISHVRNRIDKLAALLEMPDGVFPIAGLTAGWPGQARDVAMRLPPAAVVHRDRYDDSALRETVDAYDARRHERMPIPPGGQRHTDKYGVLEVCGWSENSSRQLSLPERPGFKAFLQGHGIALD